MDETKPEVLERIYTHFRDNAASVEAVFSLTDIPGPEPGVCLDGSKPIWRPYTDEEIEGIRTGDPKMIRKYTNKSTFIGHLRNQEERGQDKIFGEGDWRNMNEKELAVFKEHVAPSLAVIAYLERDGLLKFRYFSDEGDSLDHYEPDNMLAHALVKPEQQRYAFIKLMPPQHPESDNLATMQNSDGMEVLVLGPNGLEPAYITASDLMKMQIAHNTRQYVTALPEVEPERIEFYNSLISNAGRRNPETDSHLIHIDRIVSTLYQEKQARYREMGVD